MAGTNPGGGSFQGYPIGRPCACLQLQARCMVPPIDGAAWGGAACACRAASGRRGMQRSVRLPGRHNPLACRRRIRRRERCRLRPARCMVPPLGGTVSAWQSPGGKGGSCRRAGVRRAWRRRSAALYGRPIGRLKMGGGAWHPPNGGCKGRRMASFHCPALAGPVSAWQSPGGVLSGGIPPGVMRGGAGAGPPGGPGRRRDSGGGMQWLPIGGMPARRGDGPGGTVPPERCRALRRREWCLLVWCRLISCRQ